ncbi:MAG TPA: HPP family protein [Patescibacteria group bacterium]|nr:HPP family protein [Patescibacteria group bacterium]
MKILDEKFKTNYKNYIFQCTLATVVTFVIFLFVDIISSMIILASYGATTFIAFTMPWGYAARPRNIIGGYIVGSIVGILIYSLQGLLLHSHILVNNHLLLLISSALCVGITSIILVTTDTEHPPAVGMALGLIINDWNFLSILITLTAIITLTITKEILKPHLINLK